MHEKELENMFNVCIVDHRGISKRKHVAAHLSILSNIYEAPRHDDVFQKYTI